MAVSPTLEEKLKSLPTSPGCYLYKDAAGEIIYVGKAVNLRNRVRSYFQKGTKHTAKTRKMQTGPTHRGHGRRGRGQRTGSLASECDL